MVFVALLLFNSRASARLPRLDHRALHRLLRRERRPVHVAHGRPRSAASMGPAAASSRTTTRSRSRSSSRSPICITFSRDEESLDQDSVSLAAMALCAFRRLGSLFPRRSPRDPGDGRSCSGGRAATSSCWRLRASCRCAVPPRVHAREMGRAHAHASSSTRTTPRRWADSTRGKMLSTSPMTSDPRRRIRVPLAGGLRAVRTRFRKTVTRSTASTSRCSANTATSASRSSCWCGSSRGGAARR